MGVPSREAQLIPVMGEAQLKSARAIAVLALDAGRVARTRPTKHPSQFG